MKKRISFSAVLILFLCSSAVAQNFAIGHRQQTFIDPARSNRNIPAEIYYPATSSGDNVPVAQGQFPVLVFGHGFVMVWSAYNVVWSALVPEGYIMVFPTTEGSFSPSHSEFGKDIAFLAGAMKAEGANASSPFFGKVTPTSAAMGHSMGGGAAFLAVQYDSTITALATLAPAVTNPSSVLAAKNITIPAIVFSGGNDCVTPPAQHQIPMYDSLASSCKTFVSITGGSHCQFANYNINCYTGEGTCTPQPAISPSVQQSITFDLLLPWLDFYLKNNCGAGTQFQNLIASGSGISSQQNCSLSCTGIENEENDKSISVFPNPFSVTTTISISRFTKNLESIQFKLYDIHGRNVKNITSDSGIFTLNRSGLSSGFYFYEILVEGKIAERGKLIIE